MSRARPPTCSTATSTRSWRLRSPSACRAGRWWSRTLIRSAAPGRVSSHSKACGAFSGRPTPRRGQGDSGYFVYQKKNGRSPEQFCKSGPSQSKPYQAKPRKTKEMGLGFSWIPSSDSGLFNGLRAIPRKKFFVPGRASGPAALILPQALSAALRETSAPVFPCQPRFLVSRRGGVERQNATSLEKRQEQNKNTRTHPRDDRGDELFRPVPAAARPRRRRHDQGGLAPALPARRSLSLRPRRAELGHRQQALRAR